MSNQAAAAAAFAKTRELYTGKDALKQPIGVLAERYKSSNKLHLASTSPNANDELLDWDVGLTDEDPAYQRRHEKALELHTTERIATKVEGNAFDQGAVLRMSRTKALNCMELALIAAEWAYRQLGKPQPAPIGLVSLAPPADHIFCAVGSPAKLAKVDGTKVSNLTTRIALTDDVWAVDPWLNVFCNMRLYGIRALGKCMKWQQANKRVYWDGTNGAGWYAPLGEYSNGFMAAKLEVQIL